MAGELTKAGGAGPWNAQALLQRAESLGADLNVITDRDSTRISLGVTTPDLAPALEILSAVAMKPRFDATEFGKLRTRETERASSAAKSSAGYAAAMILYRELFEVPTAIHPYARYAALPAEIEKLQVADCKAWHKQHMTPRNAVLVASHGPFTWGRSVAEAVACAASLEFVARLASETLRLQADLKSIPESLLDKHFLRKHGPRAYYGQTTTRIT